MKRKVTLDMQTQFKVTKTLPHFKLIENVTKASVFRDQILWNFCNLMYEMFALQYVTRYGLTTIFIDKQQLFKEDMYKTRLSHIIGRRTGTNGRALQTDGVFHHIDCTKPADTHRVLAQWLLRDHDEKLQAHARLHFDQQRDRTTRHPVPARRPRWIEVD